MMEVTIASIMLVSEVVLLQNDDIIVENSCKLDMSRSLYLIHFVWMTLSLRADIMVEHQIAHICLMLSGSTIQE